MSKGYLSGISVLVRETDVFRGVLFNEFGITALEFTYNPQKKKVKLEQVIAMLDKWYIRRVIKKRFAMCDREFIERYFSI